MFLHRDLPRSLLHLPHLRRHDLLVPDHFDHAVFRFDLVAQGAENYRFFDVMFGIVGATHGIRVLNIVVMSIRARQLTLRSSLIRSPMSKRILSSHLGTRMAKGSQPASQLKSRLASLRGLSSGQLAQVWNSVFSRRGIFSVESEHFSTVFAFRGLLAVSSQTYQAYRASNLLPRPELNVTLLVTNCWATAGIELFLRKSPALERVFTLVYDALISFGMVSVVPLIIFLPYVEEFNLEYKIFNNPNFMFDPVPIVTMVLENRLIFAASLFDFTTKLIPQLSIMLSLATVSELLGRGDVKVIPDAGDSATKLMSGDSRMKCMEVKPQMSSSAINKPTKSPTRNAIPQNPSQWRSFDFLRKWKNVIAVVVFVIWGIVVLSLHAQAGQHAANHPVIGCRAVTRPWFSNGKDHCASLVYDCHAQKTTSPDDTSFDN